MKVRQLAPVVGDADLGSVVAQLRQAAPAAPFSISRMAVCANMSGALLSEARAFPELQALGFWLRRAALCRLKQEFERIAPADCVLVPRGLVFHIPPSNVSTMLLYSWALAYLTGNRNIIRCGARVSPAVEVMLRVVRDVAGGGEPVILQYGHEREITEQISAAADVRVIWGGDATVAAIRSIPVQPQARDVTFADRASMAAIGAEAYLDGGAAERDEVAERFYNDTYWFDQMACSSPRVLAWCGAEAECREASRDFLGRLRARITEKGYVAGPGAALAKMSFGWGAILDTSATSYEEFGNELTVVTVESLKDLPPGHCGGGLLFQAYLPDLGALAGLVERRHQTLATYGFEARELSSLAAAVGGRGIDRIVPIGRALDFHHVWDGYNLLLEFTRAVHIPAQLVGNEAADRVAQ